MTTFRAGNLRSRRRMRVGLFLCTVMILSSRSSLASDSYEGTGCGGEGPLLLVEGLLEPIALSGEGEIIYRSPAWRLPVSGDRPELLTEARVELELRSKADRAKPADLKWDFTFRDPKPYGLPFSFQALEFTPLWEDEPGNPARGPFPLPPENSSRVLEDWSTECSDPGRSLFPGGSWNGARELPVSTPPPMIPATPNPLRFRLVLWGSRS